MKWYRVHKEKPNTPHSIDWNGLIPKHIAIMMDGNGRWATRRGLPRSAGHYAGMQTMRETISMCHKNGIASLTLYAFSTENWKRPKEEVDYIISLVVEFVQDTTVQELNRNNIKVNFIGDISKFPEETQEAMRKVVELTQTNSGMAVYFAMNYGGKNDIVQAIKTYIVENNEENKETSEISEAEFEKFLYTGLNPAPDLLIRTSGEKRLSNFLLWQAAYSELWFTDVMWPDFNEQLLYESILDYQQRKQRALDDITQ
ncbi:MULTISPECIES: isoprenyl transferase [unclassified Paenibacillus]|uniref:isoprenyl transferase n=1 Tax=unclassified Paenibacillus TaxID=185978 RepID=UPI0009A8D5D1|nr:MULTISPECIES: isoprenyl transferase [unclassified Paenibacillus]SLK11958.1 undecaprenyl diphosphate synthase [Paenibacillus sp. RU5A]SOC72452.1 undecaprenyl diphosphate synthase [Paenibacillus sp. RU26A]SOC74865.1 undecaprenyl diphosphate synthase [Paenibacillus sp. RU5M]